MKCEHEPDKLEPCACGDAECREVKCTGCGHKMIAVISGFPQILPKGKMVKSIQVYGGMRDAGDWSI
jgi:hypothetical protein